MERKISFAIGEFYHIYNRGNNKSKIFLSRTDHQRFQYLLYLCNGAQPVVFKDVQNLPLSQVDVGEKLVSIGAYCLMPNHFHLLIREHKEGGITKFMEKLSTAYSMYFNKKNSRTGSLFESRFKAKHIDSDEYLKYLFAYIHLNPVKLIDSKWKEEGIADRSRAKQYLESYFYSSYLDYLENKRPEDVIVNKKAFPEYFTTAKDFEGLIDDWITFADKA